MDMQPLSQHLRDLAERFPRLKKQQNSDSSSTDALLSLHPELAGLEAASLARLRCMTCGGAGHGYAAPGQDARACKSCNGTGLTCPACRGMRHVYDSRYEAGDPQRLMSCPGCPNWHKQEETILYFIEDEFYRLEAA
jgi:hypothetical protein